VPEEEGSAPEATFQSRPSQSGVRGRAPWAARAEGDLKRLHLDQRGRDCRPAPKPDEGDDSLAANSRDRAISQAVVTRGGRDGSIRGASSSLEQLLEHGVVADVFDIVAAVVEPAQGANDFRLLEAHLSTRRGWIMREIRVSKRLSMRGQRHMKTHAGKLVDLASVEPGKGDRVFAVR
jgi:hypothetical protein